MDVNLRQSVEDLTFGTPKRLVGLVAWRVLDSIISTVPSGICLVATWMLVQPVIHPGTPLDVRGLWCCVGVLAVQAVVSYLSSHRLYVLSCAGMSDIALDARLSLGEKLRRLPMGFYDRAGAGDVVGVLQRDFETVTNYGWDVLSQVATIVARLLLALVVLLFFDWRLALATFAVVPAAVPFLVRGFHTMGESGEALTKASQEATSRSIEYAGGITTLRAFGMAGASFDALRKSFEGLREASVGREAASRPVAVFGKAVIGAGAGVVMLAGAALASAGTVDPFALLVFLLLTLSVYEPIFTLFYYLSDYANARAAGGRIRALAQEKELGEPAAGEAKDPISADVSFANVSFSYSDNADARLVLDGVDVRMPQGKVTALVGPSGSGKSTVCRLVARFWDPTAGAVQIGGCDERAMGAAAVLSRVSIVFQDVFLFQGTIADNIRMGRLDATDEEVRDAARRAAALDFIEALPQGFDTVVGEGGSTLSGGERQRVSIARALLKDAPIVLLDEATSSLDAINEVAVQQAIAELVRGKTVVVVAHRLNSIREVDNIVVIDEGRVMAQGTHAELLQSCELYARLWEEQLRASIWQIV